MEKTEKIRIANKTYEGERPLYYARNILMDQVSILDGESALKETKNVEAVNCRFEGKYPFWESEGVIIRHCHFTEAARAALWYNRDVQISNTLIEAPKTLREMRHFRLENVQIPKAVETMWRCSDFEIDGAEIREAEYLFFCSHDFIIKNLKMTGKYSFQYCKNVEIRNSELLTKDAFWETENITVYDSVISGEYLGWYSKNLHLVRCHITGTQPLCYAQGLVLEDCTFGEDADLAFEYSEVQATVLNVIPSVKNPTTGRIAAAGYGAILIDENLRKPGDCSIERL